MNTLKLSKSSALFLFFCVVVAGFIGFYFWENKQATLPPHQKVEQILSKEIDTSASLFPAEDNAKYVQEIQSKLTEIKAQQSVAVETVVELGNTYKNLRDFDNALALYAVAERMNPKGLSFLVDKGRIYLERQQWELARQVFEPMKVTWPVHETYLGLAQAYKNLDVPNYVIDDIYLESIDRNFAAFDVLEAYVKWLEATDREDQTIPYLELMNRKAPQQILEDKISALKQKYPLAKTIADVENQ